MTMAALKVPSELGDCLGKVMQLQLSLKNQQQSPSSARLCLLQAVASQILA